MLDPANRWRPVTTEYQDELAPRKRRSLRDRLFKRAPAKAAADPAQAKPALVEAKAAAGILGVTWFYLLNAAAYFVSGSVLLSFPLSDFAFKLARHAHIVVPFPVRHLEDVPFVNLLAESLFIMAVVSAAIAMLWMIRSGAARWITLLYAAAWLVRNAIYLYPARFGLNAPLLSHGARELLYLDSFAEALIFLYLLFYLRTRKNQQRLRS